MYGLAAMPPFAPHPAARQMWAADCVMSLRMARVFSSSHMRWLPPPPFGAGRSVMRASIQLEPAVGRTSRPRPRRQGTMHVFLLRCPVIGFTIPIARACRASGLHRHTASEAGTARPLTFACGTLVTNLPRMRPALADMCFRFAEKRGGFVSGVPLPIRCVHWGTQASFLLERSCQIGGAWRQGPTVSGRRSQRCD